MDLKAIKTLLDRQLTIYYHSGFIQSDPISLPHRFRKKQDIEIIAFWVAMLAWGRRDTIIKKGNELIDIMHREPYDFILNHTENDLKALVNFRHRTFQPTDALYFLTFLNHHYTTHNSLEEAFDTDSTETKERLISFHKYFFSLPEAPTRTRKHVASPARNSACKRLNMFLRWMVRKDEKEIDFGLWNSFKEMDLLMPLDVHVGRIARKLGLLERKYSDWKAVEELTNNIRIIDAEDPVKYDYALFTLGINS